MKLRDLFLVEFKIANQPDPTDREDYKAKMASLQDIQKDPRMSDARTQATIAKRKEELHRWAEKNLKTEDNVQERMPASVIKSKQRYADMTDQELADRFKDSDEKTLRQMAWRHGYGNMSSHYFDRVQKGKSQTEDGVQATDLKRMGAEVKSLYVHKNGKTIMIPAERENDFIQKGYKRSALRTEDNMGFSDKEIKMAYGVLNNPKYKGGNMTGAVEVINKIAPGLADHPSVAKALQTTNEGSMVVDKTAFVQILANKIKEPQKGHGKPEYDNRLLAKMYQLISGQDVEFDGDKFTVQVSKKESAVQEDLDYRSEDILNKAGFDPMKAKEYMAVFNDHGDTSDLEQMNMDKVGLADAMSMVLASHGIQNESTNEETVSEDAPFGSGMDLVRLAVMRKFISAEEYTAYAKELKAAGEEVERNYDDWPDGEGFGSSDGNFAIKDLMTTAGYEFDEQDTGGKFIVTRMPEKLEKMGIKNVRMKDTVATEDSVKEGANMIPYFKTEKDFDGEKHTVYEFPMAWAKDKELDTPYMSNASMREFLTGLGYSADFEEMSAVPVEEFIGVTTQWLKKHIDKQSPKQDTTVDKEPGGPTMISGGKPEGHMNQQVKLHNELARKIKQRYPEVTHLGFN